ncbi:MAG TPA: response regulator transcription factor [Dehalococcoidia bacterium]|nr:response regulator transcription factor [Dehalococcoidia bacterium]
MLGSNTRILLVDDHDVVREGLRALLSRREGFDVVSQAGTVAESISEAKRTKPDVIVMDVRLPDGSGIEACREIREAMPETKVIILTSYADDEAVFASILAGASGYVLKQTRGSALADAIAAVARGESLLDPAVTQRVMERVRAGQKKKEDDPLDALNQQERKILELIAEGKTNKEIAGEVYLSDKTVKNYVSNILTKLNLRRRSEAAAFIARRETQK